MKDTIKKTGRAAFFLILTLVLALFPGARAGGGEPLPCAAPERYCGRVGAAAAAALPAECSGTLRSASGQRMLIPGGMAFGVKFYTEGVLVVGFSNEGKNSPARAAGLRADDVILSADGKTLSGAADLCAAVEASGGREVTLRVRRNGEELELRLTPRREADGRYRAGVLVRDSGAGIGTVTYIDPDTGAFGGLGHGICDASTGTPMPIGRGAIVEVNIGGVTRGVPGDPGEIRGTFAPGKVGSAVLNNDCGVYGVFREIPAGLYGPIPAADKREVREGEAQILCSLETGKIRAYRVTIANIDRTASGGRCFTVRVTDPDLIAASGGIVQGMSGSPVIQNGKLIGAVTHVLINDPASGYGIFIGNMLSHAPDCLQ